MPELPEVETTKRGLKKTIVGLSIKDVWTEYNSPYFHGSDTIKDPAYFRYFRKTIKNAKIKNVDRRAKNILIQLSPTPSASSHSPSGRGRKTILIHMKMTGHLMYGNYNRKDPLNRHIRLIFYLSNGKTLELCDTRKFAKVTLLPTETMNETIHLKGIGPEPLEKKFTFEVFKKQISRKPNGKIKLVLMDQYIIAGIGNIYADESLWRAGIHPESVVSKIPNEKLKKLYKTILFTLSRGIDFGGDSMSDYRNIHGERGKFQLHHEAYRRTGEKCRKKGCSGVIVRIVVGGRSTHFCNVHQRLIS
ncbi:MAG: DNA-formamidopyrimidine glycosylase [Candidatus Nomurabacteria bacterium]|nr:DNA-formamidopyrimidine glycosylase [Candidatus Nomurabacteria bacterium]